MEDELAERLADEMMKFNFRKRWEEMNDADRFMFDLFCRYIMRRTKEARPRYESIGYPLLIVMLRRHNREIENLVTEWEIDKEGFVEETIRMKNDFEYNLDKLAKAKHYEDMEFSSDDDVRNRRLFKMIFGRLFGMYRKMKKEGKL